MKIADGIAVLELSMNLTGRESKCYPTLIWNNDSALLIDAGIPDSMDDISREMERVGVPFERIDTIIITHQDIDHFGGVAEIVRELPGLKVCAHKEDVPYIQGEKRLIRLNSGFMERISGLSTEDQERVLDIFENNPAEVDIELTDDKFDCFGGIQVIHTPGHTPGHICLYHETSKTLIAGDAMNIMDGKLTGTNTSILTEDEAHDAVRSLEKLDGYDIENVVCYHGGLFNDDANQAIRDLWRQ